MRSPASANWEKESRRFEKRESVFLFHFKKAADDLNLLSPSFLFFKKNYLAAGRTRTGTETISNNLYQHRNERSSKGAIKRATEYVYQKSIASPPRSAAVSFFFLLAGRQAASTATAAATAAPQAPSPSSPPKPREDCSAV
jgi:hypothetical protein